MIAIADPSLGVLSDLTTAWYAGHDGFETQKILPDLIRNVARACDAERIIFVGRSAGGFAALYYSWMIPGSVCLAINPQTKLDVYSVIDLYRHRAWPNLDKSKSLSEVIVSDLVSCYAERFENTVIYLQSAPDYSHVRHHFAPFLAGIEVKNQTRLIARLGYWGREGHGVIPAQAWLAWLSAAVTAPTAEASDIQKERQEYDLAAEQEPSPQEFDRADKLVARARIELGPELSAVNERSTGQ
jgi:pimeloyl-ACP methyl ester carboxylesterase